jgi:hypothetical protein
MERVKDLLQVCVRTHVAVRLSGYEPFLGSSWTQPGSTPSGWLLKRVGLALAPGQAMT